MLAAFVNEKIVNESPTISSRMVLPVEQRIKGIDYILSSLGRALLKG